MNRRSLWKILSDELSTPASASGHDQHRPAATTPEPPHGAVAAMGEPTREELAGAAADHSRIVARLAALVGRPIPATRPPSADTDGLAAWVRTLGVGRQEVLTAIRARTLATPEDVEGVSFADHLLYGEIVPVRALRDARDAATESGQPLGQVLIAGGAMTEDGLIAAFAAFAGVPVAQELAPVPVSAPAADLLGAFDAALVDDGGITAVVAAYVIPGALLARLTEAAGCRLERRLIGTAALETLRARLRSTAAPSRSAGAAALADAEARITSVAALRSAPELASTLLELAVALGATDIHCDPARDCGKIRFRIDGLCRTLAHVPPSLLEQLVSRIKVLASLDVTERRLPQDGHLVTMAGARQIDVRVATVPTRVGERVALRVAGDPTHLSRLDDLGFRPDVLDQLRDAVTRPHGLVLATGPVGSGKTTTLYACIQELDRERLHIASIEDPVEIALEGASQIEVNYETGLDFIGGLRALMRQDADALLVGEIRDAETAMIALRASLAGRMVFSTLHANSSIAAVAALRHFGVSSHVISSALQAVIAQRLVRRLCPTCCVPDDVPGATEHQRVAVGCPDCAGTGYLGRVAVFEVLRVDDPLRDMILDGENERKMRAYSIERGLRSLREDALDKVALGLTSRAELDRVLRS